MTRISKLLIANRGEIASRVIRTARTLDIASVAVFSDPDANAPYVGEADEAVRLPGASPEDTYLRADAVIAAARAAGADAVHPGYGFLSENADFARACADAGLVFVGPPPEAIAAMGSKTRAKEIMAQAGVPVLPGVTIADDADIPGLPDRTDLRFPLLVKAAYGGGGRGMRIVREPAELAGAVTAARREATSAFGNGTVFLERFVERPRHIEVQIFADAHGNVVHLFERECSIQRRYQKIIEEAPSPAVDETLRAELGTAAVAAAKAIGYTGAGTVEFVLDQAGEFFFLEVNTRLQVEHPVTEAVTGLDLVALQLAVAEGEPLPPEALGASIRGHAIEARVYAEDPANSYLPATGTLRTFSVPGLPGVRVDAGVRDGSEVSIHYDPMLAKVIAHAPTRSGAARLLARALATSRIHGVVTNTGLLAGILREEEFLAGRIDTGYLERHTPADLADDDPRRDEIHAVAAALADQALRRSRAPVLRDVPSGWRNVPSQPQRVSYITGGRTIEVAYRVTGPSAAEVAVDGGDPLEVRINACREDEADLEIGGIRRRVALARSGDVRYADSALGASTLAEAPRFPDPESEVNSGSLTAPMPGTVVRVEAAGGSQVAAGQVLVVLEAMKMEHPVRAPRDGTLGRVAVTAGQAVDTGAVLAVLEDETPEGKASE
ncbi:MAG: ATP-grasp domain-containing protein [Streptosporangiales bacterium]|nr:ATP-grasp domain-containing protein [Streptosporangiales bacterium]